jgi:hypothetical protein
MAARDRPASDPAPPDNDWRRTTAGFLLGVVAVGVTVNLLSEHGYPALTMITGLGAVFAVAHWLRRYPNSGMQRTVQYTLWALAAGCTAVAAATPGRWTGWLVLAAAGLLAVTVLLKEGLHEAANLLGGAAFVGLGSAAATVGINLMVDHARLMGTAAVILGVSLMAGGVSVLAESHALAGWSTMGLGVAAAVASGGCLLDGRTLLGVAAAAGGLALVGGAIAWLTGSMRVLGATSVTGGLASTAAGFGLLAEGTVLAGASVVAGGIAFLMSGSAWLVGLPGMLASATALLGVAALAAGTAAVFSGYALPGAAMLATGAALTVAGFVHLSRAGITKRWRDAWERWTKDQGSKS